MILFRNFKIFILRILNTFICFFCSFLSVYITNSTFDNLISNFLIVSFLSIFIFQSLSYIFKDDYIIIKYIGLHSIKKYINISIIYTCIFVILFSVMNISNINPFIGIIQPCFLFISIGASRYIIYFIIKYFNNNKNSIHKKNVIIFGAGRNGRIFLSMLQNMNSFKIHGFIDDNLSLQGRSINDINVYHINSIPYLKDKYKLDTIYFSLNNISNEEKQIIINRLKKYSLKIIDVSNFFHGYLNNIDLNNFNLDNFLIGRDSFEINIDNLNDFYNDKSILITGAGGSIGSELSRLCCKLNPKKIILLDCDEFRLHLIYEELVNSYQNSCSVEIFPCLVSLLNRELLSEIFTEHKPEIVFHAAAYKHVPMIERNPLAGVNNNVFGTLNCLDMFVKHKCKNFVLISSDKAVRPTNVMGATKRISEMLVQFYGKSFGCTMLKNSFSVVRFGNVIGSSGSVVPLFLNQIKNGGPITLTHPDVMRYFMTIPEAVYLVMKSLTISNVNDLFLLDMGNPIKIYDLAKRLVEIHGLNIKNTNNLDGDIEIKITGLRDGEKMVEELIIDGSISNTSDSKILRVFESSIEIDGLSEKISELKIALNSCNFITVQKLIKSLVESY